MSGAWDDIDAWAKEQLAKLPPNVPRTKTLGPDRSRTQLAALRIQRGFHPFGLRLREPAGETCGGCTHLQTKRSGGGTYFKCALRGDTNGPATDVRKRWPACTSWKERAA